jgi:hypothetical protein
MLALVLKAPTFAITEDESKRLALALKNLAQHYNFGPMNPQLLAWIQLVTVAASIYGPKLMMLAAQARAAKAAAANPVRAAGGTPVPSPAPAPVAGTPQGIMNWAGAAPTPIQATPQGTMKYN